MDPKDQLAAHLSATNKRLEGELTTVNESLSAANDQLTAYTALGSVEDIQESLARLGELDIKVNQLTTDAASINESLDSLAEGAEAPLQHITESLAQFGAVRDQLATFNEEFGTLEEAGVAINEGKVAADNLTALLATLGVESIEEANAFVEEFGNVQSISEGINTSTEVLLSIQEQQKEVAITECAKRYGKSSDDVKSLMTKYNLNTIEAIEEMFDMTGVAKVTDGDEEEDVSESYTPGSALGAIVSGHNFLRSINEDNQDDPEKSKGKFTRVNDIEESYNSPDRMKSLL